MQYNSTPAAHATAAASSHMPHAQRTAPHGSSRGRKPPSRALKAGTAAHQGFAVLLAEVLALQLAQQAGQDAAGLVGVADLDVQAGPLQQVGCGAPLVRSAGVQAPQRQRRARQQAAALHAGAGQRGLCTAAAGRAHVAPLKACTFESLKGGGASAIGQHAPCAGWRCAVHSPWRKGETEPSLSRGAPTASQASHTDGCQQSLQKWEPDWRCSRQG